MFWFFLYCFVTHVAVACCSSVSQFNWSMLTSVPIQIKIAERGSDVRWGQQCFNCRIIGLSSSHNVRFKVLICGFNINRSVMTYGQWKGQPKLTLSSYLLFKTTISFTTMLKYLWLHLVVSIRVHFREHKVTYRCTSERRQWKARKYRVLPGAISKPLRETSTIWAIVDCVLDRICTAFGPEFVVNKNWILRGWFS